MELHDIAHTKTPPTGLYYYTVECPHLGRFSTLNTVTRPPESLRGPKGLSLTGVFMFK